MAEAPALLTHLARAGLLLESLQRECLDPLGLTFVEYTVLRVLDGERLSLSRLAEAAVRTTGGMTKIVDRLERRGLVERVPDPADRRGVLVALTVDGKELGRQASEAYGVGRMRVLRRLGAAERARLETALARLVAVFEDDRRVR